MVARDMIFSAPPLFRYALVKNLVGMARGTTASTPRHCARRCRVEARGGVGVVAEGVVRAGAEEKQKEEEEGEEAFLSAALVILPIFASSRHMCG